MMATSAAFELKVPVSVVHDVADDDSFFQGEWDRTVSDRSVNCVGFRELLPAQVIVRGLPGSRGSYRRL